MIKTVAFTVFLKAIVWYKIKKQYIQKVRAAHLQCQTFERWRAECRFVLLSCSWVPYDEISIDPLHFSGFRWVFPDTPVGSLLWCTIQSLYWLKKKITYLVVFVLDILHMFGSLNSWGHRQHLEITFFYVDQSLLYTLHQANENCSFTCQWAFDVLKQSSRH